MQQVEMRARMPMTVKSWILVIVVLGAIVVAVSVWRYIGTPVAPPDTMTTDELLRNPQRYDGQVLKVFGRITDLGHLRCPCFTLDSKPIVVWYLSDPLAEDMPPFDPPLTDGLLNHLRARVGPEAAMNHYHLATAAEDALEQEVLADLTALGQSEENFQFYLVFANEVTDRYGRLLCFVNRYQPSEPRPDSYNERLLKAAKVSPYFIWPNIDPFLRKKAKYVIPPHIASDVANRAPKLGPAREWVRDARRVGTGIFDARDFLRLEPFEVRFLARRQPPDRWVIDLSKNDNTIIKPQEYYTVPNAEDRLFIPDEYVSLFVEKGWQRQA